MSELNLPVELSPTLVRTKIAQFIITLTDRSPLNTGITLGNKVETETSRLE